LRRSPLFSGALSATSALQDFVLPMASTRDRPSAHVKCPHASTDRNPRPVTNPAETNQSFISPTQQIAREAGALLMGHFHKRVKIEYKGDADLVTVADRSSEALIRERIKALWPHHDIMGEEQGLVDTGSDYRWYIDPLDGTTNFAHGFPVFC